MNVNTTDATTGATALCVRRSGVLGGEMKTLPVNHKRAHTPDPKSSQVKYPQARGALSQWTEVWPTQPAYTQAAARAGGRRAGLVSSCVEMQTLPVKRHRGDRDTHTVLALGSLLGIRFGVR